MHDNKACSCSHLSDLAVVGMGDAEELDEQVFATLNVVRDYGAEKWWLYVSTCSACGQNWMIAQDERIHDNYCLKRIEPETLMEITQQSQWPSDFLLYEQVLRLGREAGYVATFIDPESPALVTTAEELRSARPSISIEEIAYILAISTKQAARLLQA